MEPNPLILAHRKSLRMAIASTCADCGFSTVGESAMETLVEMTISYLHELARSSRALSELAGRTRPMVTDVSLALVEMGCDLTSLPGFLRQRRHKLAPLTSPTPSTEPNKPKTLRVGASKTSLPAYIPEYMPPFPDSHCFIRTPTHKPPVNEYQEVREKNASQKRDVERALTKFIAKTSSTVSLFAVKGIRGDDVDNEEAGKSLQREMGSNEDATEAATEAVATAGSVACSSSHVFNSFPLIDNLARKRPYEEALLAKDHEMPSGGYDVKTSPGLEAGAAKEARSAEEEVDNPYVRSAKMPMLERKRR